MIRVDEFLKQTIAMGKTNKEAFELLNVSSSAKLDIKKRLELHQIASQLTEQQKRNKLLCLIL